MTAQDCAQAAQDPRLWMIIGFIGQGLFSARFFVQWLASERVKRSIVPNMFWWFSLTGGLTLFFYAIHRADPVFIVGQGSGLFIYLRNIYLIYKKPEATPQPPASTTQDQVQNQLQN